MPTFFQRRVANPDSLVGPDGLAGTEHLPASYCFCVHHIVFCLISCVNNCPSGRDAISTLWPSAHRCRLHERASRGDGGQPVTRTPQCRNVGCEAFDVRESATRREHICVTAIHEGSRLQLGCCRESSAVTEHLIIAVICQCRGGEFRCNS